MAGSNRNTDETTSAARGHNPWFLPLQGMKTRVARIFDPFHALDAHAPPKGLTVWELAILKSVHRQPGLWPTWHPDTARLKELGLLVSQSGALELSQSGVDALKAVTDD